MTYKNNAVMYEKKGLDTEDYVHEKNKKRGKNKPKMT